MFLTNTHSEDVPSSEENDIHKGRIRTFAHERGNWATHVFIQCMYV